MGRLLRLVGFGIRSGVALGSVYVLHQEGVWGSSSQGAAAYDKLKSLKMSDLVGAEVAGQLPELGAPEEVTYAINTATSTLDNFSQNKAGYWNCGVTYVVDGLASLPSTVATYSAQAVEQIQNSAK